MFEAIDDAENIQRTQLLGKRAGVQIGKQRNPIPHDSIQAIQNRFLRAQRWSEGDCFQLAVNHSDRRLAFHQSPSDG